MPLSTRATQMEMFISSLTKDLQTARHQAMEPRLINQEGFSNVADQGNSFEESDTYHPQGSQSLRFPVSSLPIEMILCHRQPSRSPLLPVHKNTEYHAKLMAAACKIRFGTTAFSTSFICTPCILQSSLIEHLQAHIHSFTISTTTAITSRKSPTLSVCLSNLLPRAILLKNTM